jgi:hypothetical protein
VVYRPVPRGEIGDAPARMYVCIDRVKPTNERGSPAYERGEGVARDLVESTAYKRARNSGCLCAALATRCPSVLILVNE